MGIKLNMARFRTSCLRKEATMLGQMRRDRYCPIGKPTMGWVLWLVMLSLTCPTSAAAKNQVRIEYGEASSRELIEIQRLVTRERLLEAAAEGTENWPFQLPSTITLATAQCEEMDFFYDKNTNTITLCYEMILFLGKQAEKDRAKFSNFDSLKSVFQGALVFLMVHELGHAIIDVYSLPVTGREEDVADQFALIAALEGQHQNPETAAKMLFGALWMFEKIQETGLPEDAFRNEHAMGKQRYYNIMCWAYGKDSSRFGSFKDELQARAPRCKDEYEKAVASIRSIWQPHATQGNLGGSSMSLQQNTSSFPPFQIQVNQPYAHPSYPMFGITFDGQSLMAIQQPMGLLDFWPLSLFPEGQWNTLMVSFDRRQLPVAIKRQGSTLMAQWLQ